MRRPVLTVPALVLLVLLAGCAKRPVAPLASAPGPPGGSVPTTDRPSTTSPGRQGDGATQRGAATKPGQPGRAGESVVGGAVRPQPHEFSALPDLADVHFAFDKYEIRPDAAQILDANAVWLKRHPSYLVLIEGHCDERGTDEYNLALGERRAKAVLNYLTAQGVQAARMAVVSFGEERPLCQERSVACWTRNRRAHFLVKPQ